MKYKIKARLQNMAQDEILSMISTDTVARIKKKDKNPEFRAYVVGHEGTANPNEVGTLGAKAFRFMRDIVMGIADKISFGVPIFIGHGKDNSHEGRESIGEVVGKTVRHIKDQLTAIAAVYIRPEYRDEKLDAASIESDVIYEPGEDGVNNVLSVENVTGIALGDISKTKPAFAGATLLGVVQAMAKNEDEDEQPMKLSEIKAAIKEGKFKITDVFDEDTIMEAEPVTKAIETHSGHTKRLEKQLGEEKEKNIDSTKKLEEMNGKLKSANEKISSSNSKSLFEKAVTTRKLDDKAKLFIEKKLGEFKSDKEGTELDDAFARYMDKQVAEYEETCKLLGIEIKKGDEGDKGEKGKGGGATDDIDTSDSSSEPAAEFTDPKSNPLIPAVN